MNQTQITQTECEDCDQYMNDCECDSRYAAFVGGLLAGHSPTDFLGDFLNPERDI